MAVNLYGKNIALIADAAPCPPCDRVALAESATSAVFTQAENRMHTIKAILVATVGC